MSFSLPNRIILDDFLVHDQANNEMLKASRLSASLSVLSLLSDKIDITSAQLFGLQAHIIKETGDSPYNFQFIVDSLKSDDDKPEKPLNLSIRSIIIRNGSLKYDVLSEPDRNDFCPSHIALKNLSGHFILNKLTDSDLKLKVKRISFNESKGFALKDCSFSLEVDSTNATINDLHLQLPNSSLSAEDIHVDFKQSGETGERTIQSYEASLYDTRICPSDLSSFLPSLKGQNQTYNISSSINGDYNRLVIPSIQVETDDGELKLKGNGKIDFTQSSPQWFTHIEELHMGALALNRLSEQFGSQVKIPATLMRLGDIAFTGDIASDGQRSSLMGQFQTDAGNAELAVDKKGNLLTGRILAEGLDLRRITEEADFGELSTDLYLEAQLPFSKEMALQANGTISHFDYKGYAYQNININGQYSDRLFDGKLSLDDPNGFVDFSGQVDFSDNNPSADITGAVHHLNLQALNITDQFGSNIFDFDIKANVKGFDPASMKGSVNLTDFSMQSQDTTLACNNFVINADQASEIKTIDINSDFGDISIAGNYEISKLGNTLTHIIKSKLPNLPFLPSTVTPGNNDFTFQASLNNSQWLKPLLDIDAELHAPLHIEGSINEQEGLLEMNCSAPRFVFDGSEYRDLTLKASSSKERLTATGSIRKKQENGRFFDIDLTSSAADDLLHTDIGFNNHGDQLDLKGKLSFVSTFFNDESGQPTSHITIHPSEISINDTIWYVEPSDILLSKSRLMIDHFEIGNNEQHLAVFGNVGKEGKDSITAELHDLNVKNLSDILHVKGVDFGGYATGVVAIHNLYSHPQAAGDLFIRNFQFVDGYMGDLSLKASWDKENNAIGIDAVADAGNNRLTDIDGHIQLSPGEIELIIDAQGTPVAFVERFCGSFMNNIDAGVNGRFRIFGPLSDVNLEGKGVVNGEFDIAPLHTHYAFHNDTIRIVPDHLLFETDTILDPRGRVAIVNGSVDHHNLKDFTFDFNVNADNMLVYDHKDFGDNTFCGTVYATGTCSVTGRSGEVIIDIDATPNANTVFTYNAASPEALSDQGFIRWHDATVMPQDISVQPTNQHILPEDDDTPSDLRINFLINAGSDATLRVIMDSQSGDYIALNGNGVLRASYFNKGAFNMFGNYQIERGTYKLTIQNLITREFLFQQGGSISFGGDPYDAALDLRAVYTANSVPLSDLNVGRSFSANNIRVNCLMNIKGTPGQPTVDFDLELPTMSSDAQEMVRSLINSEEELNQQVIYLLTVGRFYNQESNMEEGAQSRTSLAMQSLLSGTISQQINSLLGNFINTRNWNFGANISTGDEGWNNAEYEGLLSGRLLNNRLLINGQFGYRDNENATTSFIGDFDIQYLLLPNGNLAINVYNQSNDRYFIKNSLNTQGIGFIMKKDFNGWRELLGLRKRKDKQKNEDDNKNSHSADSTHDDIISSDGKE